MWGNVGLPETTTPFAIGFRSRPARIDFARVCADAYGLLRTGSDLRTVIFSVRPRSLRIRVAADV